MITQHGVTDCACCGMHIMVNDTNREQFCDGCKPARRREAGKCDTTIAWHCATGECDGTMCDRNGSHEAPSVTSDVTVKDWMRKAHQS